MNLSFAQVMAVSRHLLTAAASVVGTLAMLHFISGGDAATITTALNQIGDGVDKIASGIGMLVPVVMAIYAAKSASAKSQIAAVASNPDVKAVVTTPAVASEVDHDKVVTK